MILDVSEEERTLWSERGRRLFSSKCDFVLSSPDLKSLPLPDRSEIAFIGRSNVGKSSIINALTGRKGLARSSTTPGRTQQLNFFNLGNRLRLVDLPGYGFANAPKNTVKAWHTLVLSFLRSRTNLERVFILIDSRRGLMDSDFEMMNMLDDTAVPYCIVLTKADKVTKTELERVKNSVTNQLGKHPACYPCITATSSLKGEGIAELRGDISYLTNRY